MFTDWISDRDETFDFLGITFDIRKAKEILQARPRESRPLEVRKYEGLLEMISGFSATSEVNLEVPIICLAVGKGSFPIDGWNRILEAKRSGVPAIPCVRLTAEEQALIRGTS